MIKRLSMLVTLSCLLFILPQAAVQSQETDSTVHVVLPGDTWPALAYRYNMSLDEIASLNRHINRQRQPAVGASLLLPPSVLDTHGKLVRTMSGGLLQLAVGAQLNPWLIAIRNDIDSPFFPLLLRPILLPGGDTPPRDLPLGLSSLEFSQLIAQPGQAIAFRAQSSQPLSVNADLAGLPFDVFVDDTRLVGLVGTGAFFGHGEPELTIRQADGGPLWSQPWLFQDRDWDYQQITLTGSAAAIDQQSIAEERARLAELWSVATPLPGWDQPFQEPVTNYLEISSAYGARRSYNGGPYRTYHEGVDFAAYGGTPVLAAAAGRVILAETLYVRGNAVIIDHGLGIFSGYYHLSALAVNSGDQVAAGQKLGEVGTTGLSTGNHLHWDLLVADTWVDAAAWLEQNNACWLLEGFGRACG